MVCIVYGATSPIHQQAGHLPTETALRVSSCSRFGRTRSLSVHPTPLGKLAISTIQRASYDLSAMIYAPQYLRQHAQGCRPILWSRCHVNC